MIPSSTPSSICLRRSCHPSASHLSPETRRVAKLCKHSPDLSCCLATGGRRVGTWGIVLGNVTLQICRNISSSHHGGQSSKPSRPSELPANGVLPFPPHIPLLLPAHWTAVRKSWIRLRDLFVCQSLGRPEKVYLSPRRMYTAASRLNCGARSIPAPWRLCSCLHLALKCVFTLQIEIWLPFRLQKQASQHTAVIIASSLDRMALTVAFWQCLQFSCSLGFFFCCFFKKKEKVDYFAYAAVVCNDYRQGRSV